MKVVVRTDASKRIGSGHLIRTVTLAEKLRASGCEVIFICRELEGHLCDYVVQRNFELIRLPWSEVDKQGIDPKDEYANWLAVPLDKEIRETTSLLESIDNIDWLIVDHYALDERWEQKMRPLVNAIMVIDDLANRAHHCDIILDQNLYQDIDSRYDKLIPINCVRLLGPRFALLRVEFVLAKKTGLRTRDKIERVLLFFGGVDLTNETGKALEALAPFDQINIDLIVGSRNPNNNKIKEKVSDDRRVTFHVDVTNIAELMNRADLALGAGGTTTWERCWLGLPSVIWSLADNQIKPAETLAKHGGAIYLGQHTAVTVAQIRQSVQSVINNPAQLRSISQNALRVMGDGETSGVDLVTNKLMENRHVTA